MMNYWESSSLKLNEIEPELPLDLLNDLRLEENRLIPGLVLDSISLLTVAD
jgi:hypothetical protein